MGYKLSPPEYNPAGPRRWVSGYTYGPVQGGLTTGAPAQGATRGHYVWVPPGASMSGFRVELTTNGEAGSVGRFGVFDLDEYDRPTGTALVEATQAGDAGAAVYTVTAAYTFRRAGWFFAASVNQACPTTQPTWRCVNGPGGPMQAWSGAPSTNQQTFGWSGPSGANTGAFPTWNSWGVASSSVPRVMLVSA